MTSRERWTVYPLLFLTLGISVKDKLTHTVSTKQLVCETLFVTDRGGAMLDTRRVPAGQIVCRGVAVTDAQLESQVVLGSTPQGGRVETHGKQWPELTLGNLEGITGLRFVGANGRVLQEIGIPAAGSRRGQPERPAPPAKDIFELPKDDE